MSENRRTCLILSDFNAANLDAYLTNDPEWPEVEVILPPFGQMAQILIEPPPDVWDREPDAAVVWTRPEAQSRAYSALTRGEFAEAEAVLADVDAFIDLLGSLAGRIPIVIVPTWVRPPARRVFRTLEMHPDVGLDHALLKMNLRLADSLAGETGFHVLNAQDWMVAGGISAFMPKLWFMSKIPYAPEVFKESVSAIKSVLRAAAGRTRKLVILDLDNTLWGGFVGETGWEKLRLGGHDPVGESFTAFQAELRALRNQGVLLGIVSRNDEAVALEAIRRHPEMLLGLDDFAGWRINWGDKARNVADLVAELNLGLESALFLDDDPLQQARVREALPEVLVPEWPRDPARYAQRLRALTCFDALRLSQEDRDRARMYTTDRQRGESRVSYASMEEWLATLETTVSWESLGPANLPRATQLLNRTNQMNLATRRLTDTELHEWSMDDRRRVWVFRVRDWFGDLGLTALLGVEKQGDQLGIVDFLLSCRVMGRKIEETVLATAVEHARREGLKEVVAPYMATERNGPCLSFFRGSGFREDEAGRFRWDTASPYAVPDQIRLTMVGVRAPDMGPAGSRPRRPQSARPVGLDP